MTLDRQTRRAFELLRSERVRIDPGLSTTELAAVEARFDFVFSREHKAFLQAGLPAGESWPDWRGGVPAELRAWLDQPVEGVLFDVQQNDFWPASWGARPADRTDRLAQARTRLARVPQLAPVFGHRYLPTAPAPEPSPVFSVSQTDVIYYGGDLFNYLEVEFGRAERRLADVRTVPFWSELATGAEPGRCGG